MPLIFSRSYKSPEPVRQQRSILKNETDHRHHFEKSESRLNEKELLRSLYRTSDYKKAAVSEGDVTANNPAAVGKTGTKQKAPKFTAKPIKIKKKKETKEAVDPGGGTALTPENRNSLTPKRSSVVGDSSTPGDVNFSSTPKRSSGAGDSTPANVLLSSPGEKRSSGGGDVRSAISDQKGSLAAKNEALVEDELSVSKRERSVSFIPEESQKEDSRSRSSYTITKEKDSSLDEDKSQTSVEDSQLSSKDVESTSEWVSSPSSQDTNNDDGHESKEKDKTEICSSVCQMDCAQMVFCEPSSALRIRTAPSSSHPCAPCPHHPPGQTRAPVSHCYSRYMDPNYPLSLNLPTYPPRGNKVPSNHQTLASNLNSPVQLSKEPNIFYPSSRHPAFAALPKPCNPCNFPVYNSVVPQSTFAAMPDPVDPYAYENNHEKVLFRSLACHVRLDADKSWLAMQQGPLEIVQCPNGTGYTLVMFNSGGSVGAHHHIRKDTIFEPADKTQYGFTYSTVTQGERGNSDDDYLICFKTQFEANHFKNVVEWCLAILKNTRLKRCMNHHQS